jgi:hypothetical protein
MVLVSLEVLLNASFQLLVNESWFNFLLLKLVIKFCAILSIFVQLADEISLIHFSVSKLELKPILFNKLMEGRLFIYFIYIIIYIKILIVLSLISVVNLNIIPGGKLAIFVLTFCVNIGVKLFFNTLDSLPANVSIILPVVCKIVP